jgi:isopenicillin N synthase-like dioxygenase
MNDLPVVDVSPFGREPRARDRVIAQVCDALEHRGFLYVQGLPLAGTRVEAGFAAARRFFQAGSAHKQRYAYDSAQDNFGYQGVAAERLDVAAAPDLKESFTMRNALARADAAQWPDAEFQREALGLYEAGLTAAYRMLEIIAAGLRLPADFFVERHRGENVSLRLLRYPCGLPSRDDTQLGAGAHTDYGSLTLLFQDDVGGLEVQGLDGAWRAAPPMPGCVLINTGDLMERWTNRRFRSTPHRVLPVRGTRDRYSMALFVDPDSAVKVECIPGCVPEGVAAPFAPITAGEHIQRRIRATHHA